MNECPYCGASREHWQRQPPARDPGLDAGGARLPFRPPGADKVLAALAALAGLAGSLWVLLA